MTDELFIQGRSLFPKDLESVRQLIACNPSWSRRKLSQQLCRQWDWYNAKGQMKDMACRSMMLKLDKLGHLTLPPRRQIPVNRMLQKAIPEIPHDTTPIICPLQEIQKLNVINVWQSPHYDDLFSSLMKQYHYLSYKGVVGENMKYLVRDRHERIVACLLFGSSAWRVESRDKFIGWDDRTRQQQLMFITNNMRFLILPWVRIDNLASHILGLISRRINQDWQTRYGHEVFLLETFVEKDRFTGTCYKAANWVCVGSTKGRTRNDKHTRIKAPIKDVYLYPLHPDFQEKLCKP